MKEEEDQKLILIVDDNPTNLEVLSETLKTAGYAIAVETDGESTLEQVKYHIPDLILLDIRMPGINGFETCQKLKSLPEIKDIPLIFITALNDSEDKVKGFSLGAVDYITKPFNQQEVLARVKTHLQLRQLNQNLHLRNQLLELEVKERQEIEIKLKNTLTQLKKAQKQIIAQEKLASLGTLSAGIAHELKNPLNFINNLAKITPKSIEKIISIFKVLAENLSSVELVIIENNLNKIQENLNVIQEEGEKANNIITSLLIHIKEEEKTRILTDINELLDHSIQITLNSFQISAGDSTINLQTYYDSNIPQLKVFPQSLSRAFINIINNACYAVYQKQNKNNQDFIPQIFVKTNLLNQAIEIIIKDNGEGIPLNLINKIFDPFFTTKPPSEGTGLGLSITYDIIVGQHKGQIDVNTKKELYTEFIITLPINYHANNN